MIERKQDHSQQVHHRRRPAEAVRHFASETPSQRRDSIGDQVMPRTFAGGQLWGSGEEERRPACRIPDVILKPTDHRCPVVAGRSELMRVIYGKQIPHAPNSPSDDNRVTRQADIRGCPSTLIILHLLDRPKPQIDRVIERTNGDPKGTVSDCVMNSIGPANYDSCYGHEILSLQGRLQLD